ncbi:MAG: DUF2103 domain-containing protein [Firmicutes bacterium]|nr:DUF2103 domain-containing protein [Bacillota bacterium]
MADMRHRDGKLKVMHTIIGDFGRVLRQIAELDEIESILTGTIAPSKSYRESLTFQYFTDNGLKLLAKTTTAVQEIFIVTSVPDLLLDELQKMGYVEAQREDVKHGAGRKSRRRTSRSARETEGQQSTADRAGHRQGKSTQGAVKPGTTPAGEADPLTLGQHLNPEAIAALMRVKEEATPKMRAELQAKTPSGQKAAPLRSPSKQMRSDRAPAGSEPEDFASLLNPEDEEESFLDLLNKSKLDPKFFK